MGVWILSVNNQDVALSSTDDSCSWLRPLWLWTDQFWSGLPVQVDKMYFLFVYCLTFVFFLWLNFNCFWLDEWCHVPVIGPVVWLGVGGACHLAQVKQVWFMCVCFVVWRNWTSDQTETTAEAQGWDLSVLLYLCYLNFWAKLKLPCG